MAAPADVEVLFGLDRTKAGHLCRRGRSCQQDRVEPRGGHAASKRGEPLGGAGRRPC